MARLVVTGISATSIILGASDVASMTAGRGEFHIAGGAASDTLIAGVGHAVSSIIGGSGVISVPGGNGADLPPASSAFGGVAGVIHVVGGQDRGLPHRLIPVHPVGFASTAACVVVASYSAADHDAQPMPHGDGTRIDMVGIGRVTQGALG